MKEVVIFVFVSGAVLNICTAGVFDEKQNAINEIDAKFSEANKSRSHIMVQITNEKKVLNSTGEVEQLKYLAGKTKEAKTQLDDEVTAVIRTAIVKGKPISVIHCIRSTATKASKNITALHSVLTANVTQIRADKANKIDLDEYSVAAILRGLKELLDQAKTKIKNGSEPIQKVKKEALGNCESALILLADIEIQVHEPILSIMYIKMRQDIDRTYREFKIRMENSLSNCVK